MASWSEKMLQLLRRMNNFHLPGSSLESCLRFEVAGEQVGWLYPKVASILGRFPAVFRPYGSTITFSSGLDTFESRSVAVDEVLQELRREATFTCLIGWRDEVRHLWYMLDNCPSSSLLLDCSVRHTMVKECEEEACIPQGLAEQARPVGTVSYTYEDDEGIFPECQFVFDLELPLNFQPHIGDGEVQAFYYYPIEKVKDLLVSEEFKPNCAMVVLDFLIRHAIIEPDSEPYYHEFVAGLHRSL
uniref:DUF4743 domain-containing protein n=1 Tax=Sinocyclocheilus grahami TaxID=75366 RepID=A0A672P9B9_SINGR